MASPLTLFDRTVKCSGEASGCRTCVARCVLLLSQMASDGTSELTLGLSLVPDRRQPCLFELASPMGRPRKLREGDSPEESNRGQQRKVESRRTSVSSGGAEAPKRRRPKVEGQLGWFFGRTGGPVLISSLMLAQIPRPSMPVGRCRKWGLRSTSRSAKGWRSSE